MSATQRITYTNVTGARQLIVLEPWGQEQWIEPSERIEITVDGGAPGGSLEMEHMTDRVIFWGWEGTVVSIVRNGIPD